MSEDARGAVGPPVSFMWVIEWVDGFAMMQFEPSSGRENLFSEVVKRNKPIKRACWMPIPGLLAAKIRRRGVVVRELPVECLIHVDLPPDAGLLLRKRHKKTMNAKSPGEHHRTFYVVGYRLGEHTEAWGIDEFGRRMLTAEIKGIVETMEAISCKGELPEFAH